MVVDLVHFLGFFFLKGFGFAEEDVGDDWVGVFPVLSFERFIEVTEVKEALVQHVEALKVVENRVEDLIPPFSQLCRTWIQIDHNNR